MTCYIDQMLRVGVVMALLLLAAVLGLVYCVRAIERGRVSRYRLRAFAKRHRLTITVANGNWVIRYLATTRRWRTAGFLAGLLVSVAWALSQGTLQITFLALFSGWFVGALVAEIRLARTSFASRRAASLTARVPAMYLPRTAWWLVPGLAVGSVAGAVYTWVRVGTPEPTVWLLAGVAVAIAVVVNRVQARVVGRPQAAEAPDVVAADDAIRSRSLHVLTGGGATLVVYCICGQLFAAAHLFGEAGSGMQGVAAAGSLLALVVGWSMATAQWRVARPNTEVEPW
jgi:hypothetical protein